MAGTYKVLVVDDEVAILNALERVFFDYDIEVISTDSPKEAMNYIHSKKMDMIICDQNMPEMTGLELLRYTKEVSPDTIQILISGIADTDTAISALNEGKIYYYVKKPWNSEELISVVTSALEEKENEYYGTLPSIDKIPIWQEGAIFLIDIKDILYVTHTGGAVAIVLKDKRYRSNESLIYWQNRLSGYPFYKCHRSYLVNLNKIEQIIPWSNGIYDIKLIGKEVTENIPVSKNYAKGLKSILGL